MVTGHSQTLSESCWNCLRCHCHRLATASASTVSAEVDPKHDDCHVWVACRQLNRVNCGQIRLAGIHQPHSRLYHIFSMRMVCPSFRSLDKSATMLENLASRSSTLSVQSESTYFSLAKLKSVRKLRSLDRVESAVALGSEEGDARRDIRLLLKAWGKVVSTCYTHFR